MSKPKIHSEPTACAKCLKKYGANLTNWEPCSNCQWTTKQETKKEITDETRKQCITCQELLDFLEPEPDKYICGKNKCLRNYIAKKAKEKETEE